jgi:hypothetical protein
MLELWDDLEHWSTHDQQGELGLFKSTSNLIGKWIHVGLPVSQAVLTEQERKALCVVFAQAGFDPRTPPQPQQLGDAIRSYGANHLRPRTLHLLNTPEEQELISLLLEQALEELAEWDGDIAESSEESKSRVFAPGRICLPFVDRVSGRVVASLRTRLNREFPEGPLLFSTPSSADVVCEEYSGGWSSEFHTGEGLLDASKLDWEKGANFVEKNLGWTIFLPGRSVRVFVPGPAQGLPGLVETQCLPSGSPCHIAFAPKAGDVVAGWLNTECKGAKELDIDTGMPERWRLFSVAEVTSDKAVAHRFPVLSLPHTTRLQFLGGIRSSAGNRYFPFAVPSVLLSGGTGSETVLCNGEVLAPSGPDLFSLPEGLPSDTRLNVEARAGGAQVAKTALVLSAQMDSCVEGLTVNKLYLPDESTPSAVLFSGARVWGAALSPGRFTREEFFNPEPSAANGRDSNQFRRDVFIIPEVAAAADDRILFVGRRPGELVIWPSETLDKDWEPVWAIPYRREGIAIFCGHNIANSEPLPALGATRRLLARWKDFVWHRRRRITSPADPALKALWESYVEEARGIL